MGHSREEKAQSRERILAAGARRIREAGLDGVSVAELMKAANLTHGGFYGHFGSRDALVQAALDRALLDGEAAATSGVRGRGERTVKSIVNGYLSPAHRDNPGEGCAIAALAADAARASPEIRSLMSSKLERYFSGMSSAFGEDERADDFAVGTWSAMVGAVVLSRVFADDPERSDRILAQARRSILALDELTHEDVASEPAGER